MLPLTELFVPAALYSANRPSLAVDRSFTAVSLNTARVSDPNEIVEAIQSAPRLREADLYLFQEVRHKKGRLSAAEEAARTLGYATALAPAAADIYDQGLAIVSRYPIGDVQIKNLKRCDLRFRSRNRFAMAATVRTPWGDLARVPPSVNTRSVQKHLDTQMDAFLRFLRAIADSELLDGYDAEGCGDDPACGARNSRSQPYSSGSN